jgi:hypothetical protein
MLKNTNNFQADIDVGITADVSSTGISTDINERGSHHVHIKSCIRLQRHRLQYSYLHSLCLTE